VANVAVKEIATVLQEVSSTQPQCSETSELSGLANAPATVEQALLSGTWLPPRPWFQVPALTPGPAGDGPRLFAYASSESGMVVQYRVATPSSGTEVLQVLSPILDLKGALSTLPSCEQVDRKEQEAVVSTTAPAAITSELSTASQGATQPPAETTDLQPALRVFGRRPSSVICLSRPGASLGGDVPPDLSD